jgi:CDP-diglyceride synthetase
MINVSFGPNILLGIIVCIGVLILYFLRTIKPTIARDEDIFFATIGFLYSCILMVHGWRLDPILLFSQALIILTGLIAGWENIRLRGMLANRTKSKNREEN